MREIEVKARVRNKESLVSELEKLGIKLSDPIIQNDVIFSRPVENYGEYIPNFSCVRIRKQNDKYLFTLKKSGINELDSIEHETEISNPEEMTSIVKLLGQVEMARVNKKRQKAVYKDMEICVDEVEGLGSFIELERLVTSGDPEKIQKELFDFLLTLGIKKEEEINQGYDTLMFNLNNNRI